MRAYIDSVAKALPLLRHEPRTPRRLRPRAARTTFVPVSDESIVRGLARAA